MTGTATQAPDTRTNRARPTPPPFAPDPEIIGNYEGNKRIRDSDRRAAREILRQQEEKR